MDIIFLKPTSPALDFSNDQLNHRDYIYDTIRRGYLKFKNSICFCGEHQGFIIDNYDAWGFNIPTIICSRCYAIRSKFFLDEISIMKFYKEDFYAPHMFTTKNSDKIGMDYSSYYDEELKKGKEIFNFIFKYIKKNEIKSVLEIGCGAGGILEEFYNNDISIYGCDWSEELINFAKKKMPNGIFRVGGDEKFLDNKIDLVILSDVVEHLTDPNSFFLKLRTNLPNLKYVYINCPGFFGIGIRRWKSNIREYFKIEHTYCHNLHSLNLLMSLNGFSLVYGNEYVRCIYKREDQINNIKTTINKNQYYKIKQFILFTKIKKFIFFDNIFGRCFLKFLKQIKTYIN